MLRLSLGPSSPRAVLQALPWRDETGVHLTIVAKVTLDLEREGPYDGQADARTPGVTAAFPSPPDPDSAEAAPPPLPMAQITLRGHARCPLGKSDLMSRVRLVVRRGATTRLDKTVLVHGERAKPGGLPAPFTEMPLVHERAARSAWNPVGRAMQQGDPPPNLAAADPSRPIAAFAPIPASWPLRAQLLAGQRAPAAVGPTLRSDFDRRYYLDAPHDQWLEDLAPGDVVEIEGVSSRHARLRIVLPAWDAVAVARSPHGWAAEIALAPFTLALDADREIAMITWRGTTAVPQVAVDDANIVVTIAPRATHSTSRGGPDARMMRHVTPVMTERSHTLTVSAAEDTNDGSLLVRQPTMPFQPRVAAAVPARSSSGPPPVDPLHDALLALAPPPPPPPLPSMVDTTHASELDEREIAPPAMMIPLSALPPAMTFTRDPEPEELGPLAIPSGERDPARPALLATVIEAPLVEPSRVAENTEKLLAGTLSGEALRAADLAGAELSGADLSGRDLRAARLAGAKLDGAKLDGARLDGADLSRAHLRGARLRGASLVTARLEDADLEGADLERANLSLGQLSRARFDRALLRSAVLEGAWADGASFRGADLESSSAQGLRMRHADLVGARLTEVDWPSVDLDGSDLSDAVLARAMLPEALLSGAKLEGADLRGASLRKASLRAARCQGARFDGTDLQGVDATLAAFDEDALARARTGGMKR